jgi:hypothetical protein
VTRKSCYDAGCITYVLYGCVRFGQLLDRTAGGQAERRIDLEVDTFHDCQRKQLGRKFGQIEVRRAFCSRA